MHSLQTVEASPSIVGRVLLGRYRVMAELAKGGMGVVYLARMEGSAGFMKPVVIKLILPDYSDNPEFIGMFEREAQILAHLRDPGVVEVLEFRQDDEAYVMVLEYVRGYHLGQWQRFLRKRKHVLPTPAAMLWTIEVLTALHHAHTALHIDGSAMNIVHRDVSPSNIIIDTAGRARLLDFGVARMRGEQVFKTQVQGFRGKLSYAAPELFSGAEASPRSDLYACGVVLHELLTGRNPFRGDNQNETFQNVMAKQPPPIHAVRDDAPDDIDQVLSRALVKNEKERFASAAEFANALRPLLPTSEHQIRVEMARMFSEEEHEALAATLGIDSLAQRDKLWRAEPRLSAAPAPKSLGSGVNRSIADAATARKGAGDGPARALVLVVAALGLTVVVLSLTMFLTRSEPAHMPVRIVELPTLQTPPKLEARVVTSDATEPSAPGGTTAQTPDGAAGSTSAPKASARQSQTTRNPRTTAPDPAALTRAFKRLQPRIEQCFFEHALSLSGNPKIDIEFSIDAHGKLLRTELYPSTVRGTALGRCVLKLAQRASFPTQGAALTFRIPVTARRVR